MSVKGVIDQEYQKPSHTSFSDILNQQLKEVRAEQVKSSEMKKAFTAGKIENVEEVLIQSEKANLTLETYMAIRGKLVEAYKEIMRIQI